jgi:L-fucose isomerase-like protein
LAPALGGSGEKAKVRLVLAYPSPEKPIWPNIGYDFDGHNNQFVANLRKACPGIEFMTSKVMSEADAKQVLEHDKEVDGYLLYLSGCLWGRAPDVIVSSGKPTVFVDHLFAGSGAFLTAYGRARRQGLKVAAVSSSRFEDVVEAAKCIETLTKLRSSKILVIGRGLDKEIEEVFGTKMISVDFSELNEAYNKVDPKATAKRAGEWMKGAARVIEPSREEVEKSAALYIGMSALLERHGAEAIAINCLGGFYGGHISAYPCLGFMQLNNDGFVGACEGDRKSTITMLLMAYLTGKPGYISDPVIDTAKNQIIYAHCVAPTKVFGPKGRSNRYHLRSHSEDRKGACTRSLMPLGEMTTTIMFDAGKKEVIMHQGVTVENVDEDMACRNKLAVEVKGDVYKLLNEWDKWGWHRVTFYGDHKRAVYTTAALLGFGVVEEA